MNDDWWKNPFAILAIGVGGGIALAGLGWGLSHVLRGLGTALSAIILGIAAAGGIAGTIVGSGLATTAGVAAWVVPSASAGLAATGAAAVTIVTVRLVREAKEDTFGWLIPVLAVLAAFLVDVTKEFYLGDPLRRGIFAGMTALLVVLGGVLFRKGGVWLKGIAVLCFLGPPCTIAAQLWVSVEDAELRNLISSISPSTWFSFIGLVVITVMILVAAQKIPDHSAEGG